MSLETRISTLASEIASDIKSLRNTKQPLDADLTAIAGLVGTSGVLTKTAADTWILDTSGNSATATALQTPRNINGVPFDGTADISVPNTGGLPINNPSYTGTLTGGTGVVNLGSGQFVKDASGNVCIGSTSPASDARLTLSSPTTESYLMFQRANTGVFDVAVGNNGGSFVIKGGADSSTVAGLTEFARFTSDGNLGLGVTPVPQVWYQKGLQFGGNGNYGYLASRADYVTLGQNYTLADSTGSDTYTNTAAATKYEQVGGIHQWHTAPSGTAGNPVSFTQAMTLDSAGNLGLGVTPSPSTVRSFEVGPVLGMAAGNNSAVLLGNSYIDGADIRYRTTKFATQYELDNLNGTHRWYTAPSGIAGNPISFTQAMTLDSSGNLLVGTTSAVAKITVSGVGGSTSQCFSFTGWGSSIGAAGTFQSVNTLDADVIYFRTSATEVGKIAITATSTSYATSSDARLKENVSDANNGSALIDQLQVRKFDWKADGSHQRYGFIAQELDTVFPEAVSKPSDPEQMMGVDYSKLVPLLVQEVQSLRARVAALEAK